MDLSQAPAFVAAKMAMLSDACAAAATRADELTGQISHLRDRLNGRVVREGDHPVKPGIEVDRLLAARAGHSEPSVRCGKCGTPLYEGARFCPSCGQALAPRAEA